MTEAETHSAIRAVWSIESARLIAALTRIVRDVGLAEELAQDALVAALERWPVSGVPENPGAWLMATAKNRAINHYRRSKLLERKHEELGHAIELQTEEQRAAADPDAALDDDVGDDLLRLVFTACHPVLSTDARVALTLRLLGGLTTEAIARAFLVSEPAIAQRIVRAKRTLAEAGVPFEVPRGEELAGRLSSVLEVIYLIFNEGYSATAGDDVMRPALCEDALRLGRILAELAPGEPEVHGLVALMELHASRSGARTGPSGEPVLLLDQNRGRWDPLMIRRGLAALERAGQRSSVAARGAVRAPGCDVGLPRASAAPPAETDWARIAGALRDPRRARPLPHRGTQSSRRRRNGAGACSRPRARRRAELGAGASGLSPPAERARRPPRPAGSLRGSPRGVRTRRVARAKRARPRSPPGTRRRLPAAGRDAP